MKAGMNMDKEDNGMTMKRNNYNMRKILVLFLMTMLSWYCSKAQDKNVIIEWNYTLTTGLSCKYPMLIRIYYSLSNGDGNDFVIFKHPSYPSYDGYPPYSGSYYNFYLPAGVTISAMRIAAGYVNNAGLCPGLTSGLCYSGGVFEIGRNMTDPCVWQETSPSPVLCGLSNFKVKVNVAPYSGTPIVQQGTVKPSYCPGESITFEVPCNMKGKGGTFYWYYKEGTGSSKFLKSTTSETITVGEGFDYTPKAGVNTYISVTGPEGLSSSISGSFRYGAHAPTATVTPSPPKCADGDDWYIDINNATSSDAVITSFKANIFHSSNASAIPDGFVSFSGSTGKLAKANIVSSRSFIPGTTFTMTVQNDFDPTTYGACETPIAGTYTIPNKLKITASEIAAGHKDLGCYNMLTGEIQINVANGDGNYTVKLNDVSYPIKAGSPTDQPIIEKLDGGVYTIKVNDTNCLADPISATITEPNELTVNIDLLKGLDCSYSNDGQLQATIGGGIASHIINWSDGSTSAIASGLVKGHYSVSVNDPGCSVIEKTYDLDAPPEIIVTLSDNLPTCPGSDDGSISVSNIENAPGVISYDWSTQETTSEISGLTSGLYSVTVTSKNAGATCAAQVSKFLDDPKSWSAVIQPDLKYNGRAIKCKGDENGSLSVIVKNENGDVVDGELYKWSTGEVGLTTKSIDNLSEGDYSVTVSYNGVCETKTNYTLTAPDSIEVQIVPAIKYHGQMISCSGKTDASVVASATGGTWASPKHYAYLWDSGVGDSLLANVGAGFYKVNVTDVNGCIGYDTITVVNPAPVKALIANVSDYSGFGISCFGSNNGSITATGSGGTSVYSYTWSNGKTTALNSNLIAGIYSVVVSDNNGCKDSIDQKIITPAQVALGIGSAKNISCHGGMDGKIVLTGNGGVIGTYKYSKDGIKYRALNSFDSLKIGSFIFTLKDGNGCTTTTSASLTEPLPLDIQFTNIQPAFCNNPQGTATAVVSGGVSSYNYSWTDSDSNIVSLTDKLSNAKGDVYTLTIHDSNNCLLSAPIGIMSTDGAQSSYNSTDAKCFDSSDGSALISIIQGDGPFIIKWPDGQSTLQGNNLKKGSYAVKITDVHSCTTIQNVLVLAPDPLQLSVLNEIRPTCYTYCDGELTLSASGGVGGYTYDWNNASAVKQTALCAGTYPAVIKDSNNCILNQDVILSEPEVISLAVVNEKMPTCKDGCDGSLKILASGGNGGYAYNWNQGGSGDVQNNICPGIYNIQVTDQKGCSGAGDLQLHNTPALPLDLGGGVTLCVGQTYKLDAGPWPSIQWKSSTGFASTDQQVTINEPGSYWLEVFNDKGCVGQDTFLLETSFDLLKASFMIPEEAVVEDTVVMIDITWPAPEKIEWTYPPTMKKVLDLGDVLFGQFYDSGHYEVSLRAHLGECVDDVSKTIVIIGKDKEATGGRLGYQEFVKEFTLHPNPNDGSFNVGVELLESSPIILSVWNATTGVLLKQVQATDKSIYETYFDLRPLSSGTYVLRLDHEHGKEYIRFIVY